MTDKIPIDMDLTEVLWEMEAIRQLKARYFRLVDTQNWEAWTHLFTLNCTFDTTSGGEVHGRDAFVAVVKALITPGVTVHHGYMPEITILSRSSTTGIWAMSDYIERTPEDASPNAFRGYGHYFETYSKEADGKWRISAWRLARLRVDSIKLIPPPFGG